MRYYLLSYLSLPLPGPSRQRCGAVVRFLGEAAPLAGRHLEGKLPDVVIVDERADRDDLSSPRR